jgi:hypothetical protein
MMKNEFYEMVERTRSFLTDEVRFDNVDEELAHGIDTLVSHYAYHPQPFGNKQVINLTSLLDEVKALDQDYFDIIFPVIIGTKEEN